MATITDFHNPSWVLFPVNNNRTAWRPVKLPAILVIPHRRDPSDRPLVNSGVWGVRVFIESVPQAALVAGPDHIGLRFPDRELFAQNIGLTELITRQIDRQSFTVIRDGQELPISEAVDGDIVRYTTRSGVTDTVQYVASADYFDLSDVSLEVEQLPSDVYTLVYEAKYYRRIVSNQNPDELLCIDATNPAVADFTFRLHHPGDIIEEMYRLTPPVDLTNALKSQDTTVALYRPFSDIMQDVMDEQELLKSVNWVFDVVPEAVPYLSTLLGWEIPYFPQSLDNLRKAVLRRTVYFQNLKGSRRAVIELFRLFGLEILISNLWWSSDGKIFIRAGQTLPAPYDVEQITIQELCQIEPILAGYNTPGFTKFSTPLLFRPEQLGGLDNFDAIKEGGNISLDAYLVANGSEADVALAEIVAKMQADPANYGVTSGGCVQDQLGFLNPLELHAKLTGLELQGYSQIVLTGQLGQPAAKVLVGPSIPLTDVDVSFDRDGNLLNFVLNGSQDFQNNKVYLFATYKRQQLVVPDAIKDLQSNRFDIQVLSQASAEFIDPITLEFAIEFLFKIKAFHSLLNVILTSIELTETYEVTDLCVGGDIQQRYDTDIGRLQVPPAIIPQVPGEISSCTQLDPVTLGYKPDDILLRNRKMTDLPLEHAAWAALDSRANEPPGDTRLGQATPAPGRTKCVFTHLGQDRVVGQRVEIVDVEFGPSPNANQTSAGAGTNLELSPNHIAVQGVFDGTGPATSSNNDSSGYGSFMRESAAIRTGHCDLDGIIDYCYKGRVGDEILYRPTVLLPEMVRAKPCAIGMGAGVYWAFPANSTMILAGTSYPAIGSSSLPPRYSGDAPAAGVMGLLLDQQAPYLGVAYGQPLPPSNNSMLGRLYRDYGSPDGETIHYSNRSESPAGSQTENIALQRPELDVQQATLHFPGCRFPMMNALLATYTSDIWRARPWDDEYSTACGPPGCAAEPTFLNAKLIVGADGQEYLTFDDKPFTIIGNGMTPDISSLGSHTLTTQPFTASAVVHKVYMQNASSKPAITFDGVCDYGTGVSNGLLQVAQPIFGSAADCQHGTHIDYADGYGCVVGYQTYNGSDLGRGGRYSSLFSDLGVPQFSTTQSWSVLLDTSGAPAGTDPFSLRGAAVSVDGLSVYVGYLHNSVIYKVSIANGSITAVDLHKDKQFKGIGTTDDRGYVYATLNTSSSATQQLWAAHNSSLVPVSGSPFLSAPTAPKQLSGIASQKLNGHYYVYIASNKGAATIERWNVDNVSAPFLDTTWGTGGLIDLKLTDGGNAFVNGLMVDIDGIVYAAGGVSGLNRGETAFKISADGRTVLARASVQGAMDVAFFGPHLYVTQYLGPDSAVTVLNKADFSLAAVLDDIPRGDYNNIVPGSTGYDAGYSGIDIDSSGKIYLVEQLYTLDTVYHDRVLVSSPVGVDPFLPASPLFLLGSGIRVGTGLRLDCGCLIAPCSPTAALESICSVNQYLDDNGQYDWDPDHISIDLAVSIDESLGAVSYYLNGQIPTLLETF